MRVYVRVLSFTRYISDLVTYILCIDPIKSLSRTELLKASTAGSCTMSASFFMIRSSFLELDINRSTVPVHRPLLSQSPDISLPKAYTLSMFTNQIKSICSSKRWISNTPTEGGDHSPCCTTAKENQQTPSSPKANYRLTAFFTLGINRHVSWISVCSNKASTNG